MNGAVGFTGTQQGMTVQQRCELHDALSLLFAAGYRTFHHGDCLGADAEAHDIALSLGYYIVVHPPLNDWKRAFEGIADSRVTIRPAKDYMPRNEDIANESTVLLVAPHEPKEIVRSGTWATFRRGRSGSRIVLLPQGGFEVH